MQKSLCYRLINLLRSKTYRLSLIISVSIYRYISFLDVSLESRLERFILGCLGRDNLNTLFC